MANLKVTIDGVSQEYSYAKNWDELSPGTYRKVCNLLGSNKDMGWVRMELLSMLLSLKLWWKKPSPQTSHVYNLPPAEMHTLIHNTDILGWLFSGTGPTKMMIPHFWHKGRKYYGPPGSLTSVCTIELIGAFQCFREYTRTKNQIYLDKLISLLYRPKDRWRWFKPFANRFNKDKREPLNQYRWDKRQADLKNLDHGLKVAILKQFSGHWSVFESRFKNIFVKTSAKKESESGLMNLLYDVSGKIFGTMEQTEMAPADKVFTYVDMQIRMNKELEKKYGRFNKNKQ